MGYKKLLKILLVLIVLFIIPTVVFGQSADKPNEIIFKARVLEIVDEIENVLSDGSVALQQNIKLRGIEGEYKNKDIVFEGIGDFDVVKKNIYQKGDKVVVLASYFGGGEVNYYIIDYVRTNNLFILAGLFVLAVFVVGRFKGARSLIALILTFVIIIKYIVPEILAGSNPLIVTLIGSIVILLILIYITEGINKRSHITVVSIFISLIITIFLSWFFVNIIKLSGLASEDISFLINLGSKTINFKGLLLAGIIIGALGVLDDVVISQVATTEQLIKADPHQSRKELFKKVYAVGVSHISSMTNTLFLAYAGVSLPLLILFVSGESAFASWTQIISNELIATEIVRTLAGSIGLILAVPIATLVAVFWFKKNSR